MKKYTNERMDEYMFKDPVPVSTKITLAIRCWKIIYIYNKIKKEDKRKDAIKQSKNCAKYNDNIYHT